MGREISIATATGLCCDIFRGARFSRIAKHNWRIEMSVSWLRILGLMAASVWLAAGCSSEKRIEAGGTCIMNSDCTQPLVCTMGKCHDACHTSADCSAGQCVKVDNTTICQLPAEADCSKTQSCSDGFLCASDQRCRALCQSPSDCTGAQACMNGTCHDACQVSADCPIGQSCVKTGNATICQLPAEADCSTTLSCSGGLVCASDLRCRAACLSRTDCTSEQMCVSGVCAAPSELDVNGQLPQKGPRPIADGGADVRASDAGGQGADLAAGASDVQSPARADAADTGIRADAPVDVPAPKLPDAAADLPTGTPDAMTTPTSTVALFHFDGTQGSTNFVDSSGTGKVATITGNPVISTAQSKFGGASLYINGNSSAHTNYVTVDGGNDFSLPGDFTLDFWFYPVAYPNTWGGIVGIVDPPDANLAAHLVSLSWNSRGAQLHFMVLSSSTVAPTPNAWHHVAITRAGTTFRAFFDGTVVYTNPSSSVTFYGLLTFSNWSSNGDNGDFNGFIDEVRVVKGTAVWTSSFTPPTTPYTTTDVPPVDAGAPDLPAATPDSSGAGRGDAALDAAGVSCGGSGQPCCDARACTNGGCCVANTCVASGAACSTGGTCSAGTCGESALSASPLSLDFGSVTTNQSSSAQSFAITNTGQQTSGAITVRSDSADFVVQTGGAFDCVSGNTSLAPNTACTVHIVFSPKRGGPRTGTVTFSATPGGSAGISISGVGICPVGSPDDGTGTCVPWSDAGVCPADSPDDGTGTCIPLAGVVWTQRSASRPWKSVASSSDGTKLVAASEGDSGDYIYTSSDSGLTWIPRGTTPQDWYSVASSSDGTRLVAVEYIGNSIYASANSGLTWTQTGFQSQENWRSVASSADGTKLIAAGPSSIYTSADSGATWTQSDSHHYWVSVASSSDGTKLVALDGDGYIYTSWDSGATWTQRGTQQIWRSVASSSDGTKLVAVAGGYTYTSGDSGATWTQGTLQKNWYSVASSADGTRLVAVVIGGYIYTSWDSGATWTQRGSSQSWQSVASSADGTKLVAVGWNSYIYTSTGLVR
jgi:hypothetical protein